MPQPSPVQQRQQETPPSPRPSSQEQRRFQARWTARIPTSSRPVASSSVPPALGASPTGGSGAQPGVALEGGSSGGMAPEVPSAAPKSAPAESSGPMAPVPDPTPEVRPPAVSTLGAGASSSGPQPSAEEGLEEVFERPPSWSLTWHEAPSLPIMIRQAHRTLDDVAQAFQQERSLLEGERQRLGDWQHRLEAMTATKSSELAAEWAVLEAERESNRRDLKKVYDWELVVSRRERHATAREKEIAAEEDRQRDKRVQLNSRRAQLDDMERRQSKTGRRLEEATKELQECEANVKASASTLSCQRESLEAREKWVKAKEAELAEQAEQLKADRSSLGQQMQEAC